MTNEELVTLIQSGEDKKENLERLYKKNRALIYKTIRPYLSMGLEEDDLMQEAFFGLLEACSHYDSERGVLFATYFPSWVRQSVGRYAKKNGSTKRIPEQMRNRMTKYKRFIADYEQKYRIVPSDQAICRALDINQDQLTFMRQSIFEADCVSLDSPVKNLKDSEKLTIADTVADDEDMESEIIERLDAEKCADVLWRVVDTLEEKQAGVIKCHYRKNLTMKDIAEEMQMDYEQVRRIKDSALSVLKKKREVRTIARNYDCLLEKHNLYAGNTVNAYKNHGNSSKVERVAMELADRDRKTKRVKNEMENLLKELQSKGMVE